MGNTAKQQGVHVCDDRVGTRESFRFAFKLPKTTFKAGKPLCFIVPG